MTAAIATHGLMKRFGDVEIVRDINMHVPEQAVYGFLGPNGAGKTTVMRLLLGLLRPDEGHIELLGQGLDANRIDLMRQIGAFIESPALYDHLSGHTNLDITRRLLGLPPAEVDRVLDVVDMSGDAHRKVCHYSLGMRQRTALARALLGTPRLLILDEPTNGLDPEGIGEICSLIKNLPARAGCTVLVSSHILSEVEQIADHAGLLREGQLVTQGPIAELLSSGGQYLAIEVDDAARAASLLACRGLSVQQRGRQLTLQIPNDVPVEGFASTVNTQLVTEGVAVSALRPERRTLETLYGTTFMGKQQGEAA